MKYYVTSDVHSFTSLLQSRLEDAGFFTDSEPHKLMGKAIEAIRVKVRGEAGDHFPGWKDGDGEPQVILRRRLESCRFLVYTEMREKAVKAIRFD